jgi:hypothetical protein
MTRWARRCASPAGPFPWVRSEPHQVPPSPARGRSVQNHRCHRARRGVSNMCHLEFQLPKERPRARWLPWRNATTFGAVQDVHTRCPCGRDILAHFDRPQGEIARWNEERCTTRAKRSFDDRKCRRAVGYMEERQGWGETSVNQPGRCFPDVRASLDRTVAHSERQGASRR